MFKNMCSKLIWLATMIAGFVLIDIGELTGVINGFIENALVTIGITIILAVGLNLIIGFFGQFSRGHACFMAIGAYATAIITQNISTPLRFYLAMLAGMIVAIIAALIVGILTMRLRGDYLAIATIGAVIASGTPNEIQTNAQVISAYLGGENHA